MVDEVVQPEVQANARAFFGLDRRLLAGMTLESFISVTDKECSTKRAAEMVAARWAEGTARSIWFWSAICDPAETRTFGEQRLLVTGCGCGKTHLMIGLAKLALGPGKTIKIATETK